MEETLYAFRELEDGIIDELYANEKLPALAMTAITNTPTQSASRWFVCEPDHDTELMKEIYRLVGEEKVPLNLTNQSSLHTGYIGVVTATAVDSQVNEHTSTNVDVTPAPTTISQGWDTNVMESENSELRDLVLTQVQMMTALSTKMATLSDTVSSLQAQLANRDDPASKENQDQEEELKEGDSDLDSQATEGEGMDLESKATPEGGPGSHNDDPTPQDDPREAKRSKPSMPPDPDNIPGSAAMITGEEADPKQLIPGQQPGGEPL